MTRIFYFIFFLGLWILPSSLVWADDSVYDVINREDMDTFSDMVVLGYDVDDSDADGFTPLMIAAALNKTNFAQFLIANGANVNKRSLNGLTAVHRAAQAGHNEMIDILYGADASIDIPDFDGNTPLMYAVAANRRFTVERLVALGANINYYNARNETALKIAEKKRFKEIVAFLRSKGAR